MAAATVRAACLMALAWLPAVLAAEQRTRPLDGSLHFWVAAAVVMLLSFAGYAASSLPEWAKWKDESGDPVAISERRLKIIQGLVLGMLAGNIAYYGALYYLAIAEVACFIGAVVAAYGGDRFLSPLLSRVTGRAAQVG
jgi:hypothetical protein